MARDHLNSEKPESDTPSLRLSGATSPIDRDHREASDRYIAEIYRLGIWRVAVCRDGIQWLLQRHTRAQAPDGGRWEAKRYCVTREALIRDWRALTGDHGEQLAALLPERCKVG